MIDVSTRGLRVFASCKSAAAHRPCCDEGRNAARPKELLASAVSTHDDLVNVDTNIVDVVDCSTLSSVDIRL